MKRVSLKEAPSHMELTDWRFRNINRINHDHSLITSVVLITTTARQMTSAVNVKDQDSIGTSFQRTREKAAEVWTRDLYDFKCLWHGIEDMESRSNFVICFFFLFLSLVVQTMFILMQVHVQRNFANDVMECQGLTTYKRTMRSK